MHGVAHLLVIAVVLGALTATAGAAERSSSPPLRRFAAALARTDGQRFVVLTRSSSSDPDAVRAVAVFDEHSGRMRTLPGGCPAIAVGTNFLLAGCLHQPPRVFDLAHRTHQAIAPIAWPPPGTNDEPISTVAGIGARWLALEQLHRGGIVTRRYQDWRTGRIAREAGAGSVPDLDTPALARPLCEPLSRPLGDSFEFADYQYERPYAVYRTINRELLLCRCGHADVTVVAHRAASIQLAGGVLTWLTIHPGSERRRWHYDVHALLLLQAKTALTWRLALPRTRRVASVQHTARAVYVTVTGNDERTGKHVVLRAPLRSP